MNNPNYQQPMVTETSGWAIFSLISGILGWLGVFGLGGLIAVIAGHIAKNQIRNNRGRIGGEGLATAGLVLGYLNIGLAIAGGCFALLVFGGLVSMPICFAPYMNGIQ
ncbi:MAG: DUF4190 domain-containing protein [Leptolinea sp.]